MSALSNEVYLTPEEYLVRERESEGKNEYVNGLVVSMAGAKHRHNLVPEICTM